MWPLKHDQDIYEVTSTGTIKNHLLMRSGTKYDEYPTHTSWQELFDNPKFEFGPSMFTVHIRVSPFLNALSRVEVEE